MNAYGGKILRVSLSRKKIETETVREDYAKKYLGGRGFGARILWDEVKGVEPLSPGNKVIIAAGPLSGLYLAGSGKTSFHAKSPLTGGYADSNVGGLFSPEMKHAGIDAIIIEGVSSEPVYLFIDDDRVEIRDAKHLWGKGAITTEEILKKELGRDFQIAAIGQGGENLVKYACVNHDYGREAGRAGIGAVMGSKKLKAVAVRGTKDIPIADLDGFLKATNKMWEDCFKHPALKEWQDYGTTSFVEWASEAGALPTRNFQTGTFEDAKSIGHITMREKVVKLDKACYTCPMACGKYSYSPKYTTYAEGAEYETLALLGANCAINDIEAVIRANYLCDEYGIDTISTGNVIAFVMEATERGIMNVLRFGEIDKYLDLIPKIALREGIGDELAEGVASLAKKYKAEDFAIQIKGMEQSGYESRGAPAMLLSYMTCDVGAHHNRSWAIMKDLQAGRDVLKGKPEYVADLQHKRSLFDILGLCRLQWIELTLDLNDYAELFSTATGWKTTLSDLLSVSERIYNLTRAYWFREMPGFGKNSDNPPVRAMKEKIPSGPTKGYIQPEENINKLLSDYYKVRGWDENGKPTKATMEKLGLADVASEISSK
ncbi:MAG: aldehyde ferredoxin oxidoreductase family protein [Planctomycetota bacterium]